MLHLIPAPLHRLAYRLAHGLRKRWWRIARPVVIGCRVLAFDGEGRLLLVRHSYGSGKWLLPGGGISRGEDPVSAGARELREETGCRIDEPFALVLIQEPLHGARNIVHVIAGTTADTPAADGREIVAARFFATDALPDDLSAAVRNGLTEWLPAYASSRT